MTICAACGSSEQGGTAFCTSCGCPRDPSLAPQERLGDPTAIPVTGPAEDQEGSDPDKGEAGRAGAIPSPPPPGAFARPGQPGWERWGPPPAYAWPRTCAWATAGIVFAFLCAPLGLLCSAIALVEINRSQGLLRGHGLAIAGLVVSILMLLVMTYSRAA